MKPLTFSDICDNPTPYELVKKWYGNMRAKRSGRKYIEHIKEGCFLLDILYNDMDLRAAFCIYPIIQSDVDYESNIDILKNWAKYSFSQEALSMAIEYRKCANLYSSKDKIKHPWDINTGNDEVKKLLIADKIQNWKDAMDYVYPIDWKSKPRLDHYFSSWLFALNIDGEYGNLMNKLRKTFPLRHDLETKEQIIDYYRARFATEFKYRIISLKEIYLCNIDSKYSQKTRYEEIVGVEAFIANQDGSLYKSFYIVPKWRNVGLYGKWTTGINKYPIITSLNCGIEPVLKKLEVEYCLIDDQ